MFIDDSEKAMLDKKTVDENIAIAKKEGNVAWARRVAPRSLRDDHYKVRIVDECCVLHIFHIESILIQLRCLPFRYRARQANQ